MRVGFASLFSYRPHVQHTEFLAKICKNDGHEIFYLTCDANLNSCYTNLIRKNSNAVSKNIECSKCVMGGIRSYANNNISSISSLNKSLHSKSKLDIETLNNLTISSASTILRVESDDESGNVDFKNIQEDLFDSISIVYNATLNWIKTNDLQAIVVFNGRMDITSAVIAAAKALNVNFITHERTWFGDGIRIIPNNNCLSISDICRISNSYKDFPLTKHQAIFVAKLMAERFVGKNKLEWRLYNTNSQKVDNWPSNHQSKVRYLVIPSSRNEFMGNDEFQTSWINNTSALKDLFDVFNIDPKSVVVRGHPNWSENISSSTGVRSSNHYKKFCNKLGITYISSNSNISTYSLIQLADIIIVNGGSSSIEAATLGKPVVCLSPSQFQNSGFVTTYTSRESMLKSPYLYEKLLPSKITQLAMRHVYTAARRFPMFVDEVKALSTTNYLYSKELPTSQPIIDLLNGKKLSAYDDTVGDSDEFESILINLLHKMDWYSILSMSSDLDSYDNNVVSNKIDRKGLYKIIEVIRPFFKRGDL